MSIETVLLAVGPMDTVRASELAETVLEIATPLEATVVIGHAFTETEYESFREELGFESRLEDVDPDAVAMQRPPVSDLHSQFTAAGIETEVRGAIGEISDEIIQMAIETDADRIVVGSRQQSPAEKAVLGSISQEIILSAPCPVTYVRESS